LLAIPPEIRAYGIEIDPEQAELARQYTGRTIIIGDFRTVKLPEQPTIIIGNPPFEAKVIDGFLTRAHQVLPRNGEVGFIQPAYFWQTASRIVTYNEYWSLEVTMIPRNLYEGLSEPLVFAIYRKDNLRKLIGLAFYHETYEVQQLPDKYREVLTNGKGPIWKTTVTIALGELGGEADLEQIYGEVSEHRPTENPFWKEKIRQVLGTQPEFAWVREGRYRFATEKEAA
jgi:site-specific DNA-methyltransferase (adenine-specific)